MSFYIKIVGGLILLACAFLIGKAYESYAFRAISEYEAFLSMLGHIKNKINCFLMTTCKLLCDFESGPLEESGFLPKLREGKRMSEAFEDASARLAISKEAKKLLSVFFEELGVGYKDEELNRISGVERELSSILSREREEMPKNVRIAKTLLLAAALGILILII